MKVTAKADYAVRAMVELAAAQPRDGSRATPVKALQLAEAQGIPLKFLEGILADLRHADLVGSQRGSDGGYWLRPPAAELSVATVIRAVEGPLADVRGVRPEQLDYEGDLEVLQRMWVAVRASLRSVLEGTTLAHLRDGALEGGIDALTDHPDAWVPHS